MFWTMTLTADHNAPPLFTRQFAVSSEFSEKYLKHGMWSLNIVSADHVWAFSGNVVDYNQHAQFCLVSVPSFVYSPAAVCFVFASFLSVSAGCIVRRQVLRITCEELTYKKVILSQWETLWHQEFLWVHYAFNYVFLVFLLLVISFFFSVSMLHA